MKKLQYIVLYVGLFLLLNGCISITNETVDGAGTPDITECTLLEGVLDGKDYTPQDASSNLLDDNRTHPDLFYIGWAELNSRVDLRSPEDGYSDTRFEDKLFVSRKQSDGSYKTWQLYPKLEDSCKDLEHVRIQSFDVAPDGKSLYISVSKPVFAEDDINKTNDLNPTKKLGIFKLDISSQEITPVSNDYSVSYSYPTYIGDDNQTGHEMLLISKTVTRADIPINYKESPTLRDEYDRRPAPLIHTLDTVTRAVTRIGFNNSHQTEATVINRGDNIPLVVFTQWEHQATVNRFSLWKMQIDGSDNFMYFGEEADTLDGGQNLYQARQIKSGPYKDYILMGQAGRTGNSGSFLAEGHILMVMRDNLDLRSDKIFLSKTKTDLGLEQHIARTPEHYNDSSFVYAYRQSNENSYGIYIKDYPSNLSTEVSEEAGELVISSDSYHFMQPRSFYPPKSRAVAPGVSDLSENRFSFTNDNLHGKSGFLVNTLGFSDNGEQNQLNGIDTNEVRMQFQVPSHHFTDSYAIGMEPSQELSIPSSNFIKPESDGSMGVILKEGLYIWKLHKRFGMTDGGGDSGDLWIPIRSERQEVSFVSNRVNACNQCHQDRNQDILDKYEDYHTIAEAKMQGDLVDVFGTDNDISEYNATKNIPDFHQNVAPLFEKPGLQSGKACVDCHNSTNKLNLSNKTGISSKNMTYRSLVLGAHKIKDSNTTLPYLYGDINPMGMDEQYHPAPFLWSLLLDDDLSVAPDDNHSNTTSRNLERAGDYGAKFSTEVNSEISRINTMYNHSKHWSLEDTQAFVEYSTNRLAVGLSDRITFQEDSLSSDTPQAQKAYQALVRNCYSCHNTHTTGGVRDENFEDIIPKQKRFADEYYLRDSTMRFAIHRHLASKGDTAYSQYLYQGDIRASMSKTLGSALYRIDFDDIDNSEILVYARGYRKNSDGNHTALGNSIKAHIGYLDEGDGDYEAIKNWLNSVSMTNQNPVLHNMVAPIVLNEYDDPKYIDEDLVWSDADDELSQLFLAKESSSEHIFNDSMLALEYQSLVSAKLKAYAMLGDRGDHNFTFSVSDGLDNGVVYNVPVTITTDYNIPPPSETLPTSYLFFTDRQSGMLKKLDSNGTEVDIGLITGFTPEWTTVYRRSDKGWLYFVEQSKQKIHVVSELDAEVLFDITLNNLPNQVGTSHKQTLYLIWWRPAEGEVGDANYSPGELQGLLESKLSSDPELNGDFYVNLGSGESNETTVIPEWRTKLLDGGNTLDVYVWRRATFMTKLVNDGVDRMNALNLVTGKPKYLTDFNFTAQTVDGVDYNASSYDNVRAIVVAEDGAFYGFNKDLNDNPMMFSFDPLAKIQKKVIAPKWVEDYIEHYTDYATPFFVVEPRDKGK